MRPILSNYQLRDLINFDKWFLCNETEFNWRCEREELKTLVRAVHCSWEWQIIYWRCWLISISFFFANWSLIDTTIGNSSSDIQMIREGNKGVTICISEKVIKKLGWFDFSNGAIEKISSIILIIWDKVIVAFVSCILIKKNKVGVTIILCIYWNNFIEFVA